MRVLHRLQPVTGPLKHPYTPVQGRGAAWCLPQMSGWQRKLRRAGHEQFLGTEQAFGVFLELMSAGLGYNLYRDNSLCHFLKVTYFSASFSAAGTQLRPLTGASWHRQPRRCLCVGCDTRSALLPGFSSGKTPKTQCCLPSGMGPVGRNGLSCNMISYTPANEINLRQEGNTG